MRTILIPTDFTVDSLMAVKKTLSLSEDEKVKIILFHCISLSDSITDLLTFSKGKFIRENSNQTFKDACEIIRNKFALRLSALHLELFTGNTANFFDNFVEASDAEIICFIENYDYKKASDCSVDPLKYIVHAKIPALKMTLDVPAANFSQNRLAVLFS